MKVQRSTNHRETCGGDDDDDDDAESYFRSPAGEIPEVSTVFTRDHISSFAICSIHQISLG
jgi:hypothetical protein